MIPEYNCNFTNTFENTLMLSKKKPKKQSMFDLF